MRPTRAIVLAAGLGTRLGEITADRPKPMLELGGRPLLEHILSYLRSYGITEVVVNLHYLPDVIRDYFGDGSALGIALRYSEEARLLGTAGALRKARASLGSDRPFLVHYGDILTDQNLYALFDRHQRSGSLVTALLHRRVGSNSVAQVGSDGRITAFWERPEIDPLPTGLLRWAFSGLCVCEPNLLHEVPEDAESDLPRDYFPALARAGQLAGMALSGYRCAIDSPRRLDEARRAYVDGRYRDTIQRRQAA